MKAMILAAGRGTRLAPLTDYLPKPLFPVLNRPLIEYNIEMLKAAGVTDIIINLFHLGQRIEEHLEDGARFGVRITYSREDTLWGTGGGLLQTERFFANEDLFLVVNGDSLFDADLAPAVEFHRQREAAATMVLTDHADLDAFGVVELGPDDEVVRISDKLPRRHDHISRVGAFTGVHILSPAVFEYIPPAIASCINAYAYPRLIANGHRVLGYVVENAYWNDLGTPERVFATNMELLQRRIVLTHLDPFRKYTVRPRPGQVASIGMGADVSVGNLAQVQPPVALGDRVLVGEESVIGPGVCLGDDATVGRRSSLSGVIVLQGTTIPEKSRLEQAIVAGKHRVTISRT